MWFISLWVRFVTIMISEKKARIMTNNIVADINHILDVIAIINQVADVELERGNKQNGCVIALNVLQKADGDKIQAGMILHDIRNTMIAYYDYQIEIEKIRSKALRKLDIELERS